MARISPDDVKLIRELATTSALAYDRAGPRAEELEELGSRLAQRLEEEERALSNQEVNFILDDRDRVVHIRRGLTIDTIPVPFAHLKLAVAQIVRYEAGQAARGDEQIMATAGGQLMLRRARGVAEFLEQDAHAEIQAAQSALVQTMKDGNGVQGDRRIG
jgi:hypothetical protein